MVVDSVLNHSLPNDNQQSRAWDIVRAYGRTSLARYALLPDKAFFFSPGGSLVSYVVKHGVAMSLGDPIGPPADVQEAIAEFRQFCARKHWLPIFYQVQPDYLDCYKSFGFQSLGIGQEAIVDLEKFTLEGTANGNVRNRFNKMLRLGYCSEVILPPFSQHLLHEIDRISDEWLVSRGANELRFLGWFDRDYLNTCPLVLVRDREARIQAFANLVTEFQASEIRVDLMRRRPHGESGLMDFLFLSAFRWAKADGYARFNLGPSPLSGVGERATDPFLERVFHYIYRTASFYNFRGLHTFKDKFHPVWSPRYLIYPRPIILPLVGIALLKALNAGLLKTSWLMLFHRHR